MDLILKAVPIEGLPHSCECAVTGTISATNARLFQEGLQKKIDARDVLIVLLMKEVAYVNSSGFGYLIDLSTRLERRGGVLVLVEVQPKVKLVLENLGVARYFHFESTVDSARTFARSHAEKVLRSPRMMILEGAEVGVELPIVGTSIRIGSDPKATVTVRHPHVEPRHAEIYRVDDRCFVRDLGTRHGTFVGDRKVNDEPLSPGDVVKVGHCRMVFVPAGARKSGVFQAPPKK